MQLVGEKIEEGRAQSVLSLSREEGHHVVQSGFPDLYRLQVSWEESERSILRVHTHESRQKTEVPNRPRPLTEPGWLSLNV